MLAELALTAAMATTGQAAWQTMADRQDSRQSLSVVYECESREAATRISRAKMIGAVGLDYVTTWYGEHRGTLGESNPLLGDRNIRAMVMLRVANGIAASASGDARVAQDVERAFVEMRLGAAANNLAIAHGARVGMVRAWGTCGLGVVASQTSGAVSWTARGAEVAAVGQRDAKGVLGGALIGLGARLVLDGVKAVF